MNIMLVHLECIPDVWENLNFRLGHLIKVVYDKLDTFAISTMVYIELIKNFISI